MGEGAGCLGWGVAVCVGSCLRRNDDRGAGMTGWGVGMTVGVRGDGWSVSVGMVEGSGGMIGEGRERWLWLRPLTPHLTSPLEGGRDELGKGEGRYGEEVGVEWVGSARYPRRAWG